jgi:hypothetical protein
VEQAGVLVGEVTKQVGVLARLVREIAEALEKAAVPRIPAVAVVATPVLALVSIRTTVARDTLLTL